MNILILGYGYSGFYCAKNLLERGHKVMAVSRTYPKKFQLDKLQHICSDMRKMESSFKPNAMIYCAPPPSKGNCDELLSQTLLELESKNIIANILYWGSSGVYGDHQGQWVDERSPLNISSDIQRRRLDAENQIKDFAKKHSVHWSLMRVSGMFGPGRMPSITSSIIQRNEAPYTNLIYIEDVANLATEMVLKNSSAEIINISDGFPKKMGDLQRMMAETQKVNVIEKSLQEIMLIASPMMRYFISSSKRLSNKKCLNLLPNFIFSDFKKAVEQSL
jgi:nucleoside-diphosphate-sugar epimerase